MTKENFLNYCKDTYETQPDYPFDDFFETAVMKVSRRKFGLESDEVTDVVNLKLPIEMFGSFGTSDGVYPAYHMNKLHWISVILSDASEDVIKFLVGISYDATKAKKKIIKNN